MLQSHIELDLQTRFIKEGASQTETAGEVDSLFHPSRGREQIAYRTFLKILYEPG